MGEFFSNYFKKVLLAVLQLIFSFCIFAQQLKPDKTGHLISMDEVDISTMVQPLPEENRFIDSNFNIWCGSVTKGKNGQFYMLYSRWPKKVVMKHGLLIPKLHLQNPTNHQGPTTM